MRVQMSLKAQSATFWEESYEVQHLSTVSVSATEFAGQLCLSKDCLFGRLCLYLFISVKQLDKVLFLMRHSCREDQVSFSLK